MSKWNEVYFEGNIGKEPTSRTTQKGSTITSFSLAVYQGKEKPTMWLEVKSLMDVPFTKGAKVAVRGSLFMDDWKGRDGDARQTWGVWASAVNAQGEMPQMAPEDVAF